MLDDADEELIVVPTTIKHPKQSIDLKAEWARYSPHADQMIRICRVTIFNNSAGILMKILMMTKGMVNAFKTYHFEVAVRPFLLLGSTNLPHNVLLGDP
ncbi:hypothetical protein Tco_0969220 [Tanacetum coccineum]